MSEQLTFDFDTGQNQNTYTFICSQEQLKRGLYYEAHKQVASAAALEEVLDPRWRVLHTEITRSWVRAVVYLDDSNVLCSFYQNISGESIAFSIYATETTACQKYLDIVTARIPILTTRGDGTVPFYFWADNEKQGPTLRVRRLTVPNWADQAPNYPVGTRSHLDEVMNLLPPFEGGNLLLLHGEPGLGKSFAIRSLAKEWSPFCDVHYIVDPENFFGRAEYLLDVVLSGSDTHYESEDSESPPEYVLQGEERYRLLIVEDADEFLRKDAKERQGQAMSRLLNTTDGLIGQGLKLLVLITTNEPINNIHPAIAREGRCLANVEFDKFHDREAIEAWLGEPMPRGYVADGITLAQMFNLRRERQQIHAEANKKKFGQYL